MILSDNYNLSYFTSRVYSLLSVTLLLFEVRCNFSLDLQHKILKNICIVFSLISIFTIGIKKCVQALVIKKTYIIYKAGSQF